MSDRAHVNLTESRWLELRDDRGKLCARLQPATLRLEVRRNDRNVMFSLRDVLSADEIDLLLLKE